MSDRLYGVYPALVSDVKDPDGQGRVKVKLPWAPDSDGGSYEAWARLAAVGAGKNRGAWFVPDANDEVLVAFEGGDPSLPFVVGGLWNGVDPPPETMDGAGRNNRKVIRSRNGTKITLDDTDGSEKLVLETPGGQRLTLQDGPGSVELRDANGNSIKLESSGITIDAAASVKVKASKVEVSAGAAKFSGTVECVTLVANSVVASSYTPGAGNVW